MSGRLKDPAFHFKNGRDGAMRCGTAWASNGRDLVTGLPRAAMK